MMLCNSQERTLGEFVRLGEETGWKLASLHRGAPGEIVPLVYVPI